AEARKVLNTLTAAEQEQMRKDDLRASRDAGDRVKLGGDTSGSGSGSGSTSTPDLGKEVPASKVGATALQAASTRVGMPYSPAATGPNSFDCSGLTQWAYRQAGVEITRVTYTQINQGTRIAQSQLKPGDLVFFNNTTHVGLYAGNNTVLHAPYPGAYVRYESMNTIGGFQAAVRI
ncbi:C40 family peptidase, partial [Streptomyces sp. NPDC058221]|uniref:C40 family peptidase n=1 Tax=Streptomyces sp. NPDC058221 TaxID=3346388 RepID=UPI0036E1125A